MSDFVRFFEKSLDIFALCKYNGVGKVIFIYIKMTGGVWWTADGG